MTCEVAPKSLQHAFVDCRRFRVTFQLIFLDHLHSELISADHSVAELILEDLWLLWSLFIPCFSVNRCGVLLPPLPPSWFMGLGKYWVRLVFFFHWTLFSAMVPGGSCMQGWFPLAGLPWIPPSCAWSAQAACLPASHQFPSSLIGDEFNLPFWQLVL